MALSPRQLHLNTNITDAGKHPGAWRHNSDPFAFIDIDHLIHIARVSESAGFDAVFLSDAVVVPDEVEKPWQAIEPTVLLACLATATERIGLIGTASTSFNDPFNIARRFGSLDHVSHGRAALNVVTTREGIGAGGNFGVPDVLPHEDRYGQAEEFTDVLFKLWDSWEDGALVGDQAGDHFVDNSLVHRIDHEGRYYNVRGPLTLPRSPQGRPVLVQAGSSEEGMRFASRIADIVFTVQTTIEAGQAFYSDIRGQAARFGRDPESVLILPGLFPIVGSTEAEAIARKNELDELFPFDREVVRLGRQIGVDHRHLKLDEKFPVDKLGESSEFKGSRGFRDATIGLAVKNDLTVRELLLRNGGAHRQVVGAPDQVVDDIEHWFRNGAADGFNLNFDVFPSGLELFVAHVVPELRRRGLFRTEYTGTTLREHLGLNWPVNQYENVDRLQAANA
jgi:FMN-dependent oxidoreductase (nitrilotriacetate monooxygenase family)